MRSTRYSRLHVHWPIGPAGTVGTWCRQRAVHALLLGLVGLQLLLVSGCSGFGGRKRVDWVEQVQLLSGERILIPRWHECQLVAQPLQRPGCLFYAAGITVRIPGGGGQLITWEGPLSPLALDVVAGRTYMVATAPGNNPALQKFRGLISLTGHVAFELRGAEWVVTTVNDLPLVVKPNLLASTPQFLDGSERIDKPFVTVERRIKLNDLANNPQHFESIPRIPAPKSP